MKISMLMENKAAPGFACAHGVSIHIAAQSGRRLLFDFGPDAGYAKNAERLGISLAEVDTAVLSHAHYDHGGGLGWFLQNNQTAPVYVGQNAFDDYLAIEPGREAEYVGIDKALANSPRIKPATGPEKRELGDGLSLFGLPPAAPRKYLPAANAVLYRGGQSGPVPDDFAHEQNLLLREGETLALFSGCAHSGILNVMEEAKRQSGQMPNVVLGGFHLHNPDTLEPEDAETLAAIADFFEAQNTRYYAFHCTGDIPFEILKARLGARIGWLRAGDVLEL